MNNDRITAQDCIDFNNSLMHPTAANAPHKFLQASIEFDQAMQHLHSEMHAALTQSLLAIIESQAQQTGPVDLLKPMTRINSELHATNSQLLQAIIEKQMTERMKLELSNAYGRCGACHNGPDRTHFIHGCPSHYTDYDA